LSRSAASPTRMNLLRIARRLDRVARGGSLLRKKREALVARLFGLARPARDARARIAEASRTAYAALLPALARHGDAGLRAIGWPTRAVTVDVESEMVWGIPVATITRRSPLARTLGARATAPAGIGPAAIGAAQAFETLVELLLDAAPGEALLRRLGEALAQTSRQVNSLERRVAPALARNLTTIRRVLDEREREERWRETHLGPGQKACVSGHP